MNMKTLTITAVSLLIVVFSFAARADEITVCTHGDKQRVLTIAYENQGSPVPCMVTYEKARSKEVLWTAKNLAGYCESKTSALVEKHRGWGWTCVVSSTNGDAGSDTMDDSDTMDADSMDADTMDADSMDADTMDADTMDADSMNQDTSTADDSDTR